MNKGSLLVLVGSLLLIVGGFLPRVSLPDLYGPSGPSYRELGWEGDATLIVFFGLMLLLSELLSGGETRWWLTLTKVVLTALATTVVYGEIRHILEQEPEAGFFAATEIGFYVPLVGALLALIGCIWGACPSSDTTGDSDHRSNGLAGP